MPFYAHYPREKADQPTMIKKMSPSESDFDIPAKNCYRMVILGSTKVGKTAIVSRFLNAKFDEQYTPTIEDFHRKLYSIKGDVYQLDILDTSGNHPFPAMRRLSILTDMRSLCNECMAAACTTCYILGLDNRDSFQEVQRLKKQIFETKSCLKNKIKENIDVPLVICGNKGDRDFYREVQQEEIEQLVAGDEKRQTETLSTASKSIQSNALLPFYAHYPREKADQPTMIKKMSPSESDFDIPAKNCYRMVILGSTKVGKTAIVSRFLNAKFDEQYTPTIEDFHRKLYSIKGDVYQLDILDTSGNHPFPAMRRLSILTGKYLTLGLHEEIKKCWKSTCEMLQT
ncbi:hypothetical protein F7725_013909 [Dissostichus mawsoni]|uniref:Small monomeric GTPase n=1 Tax=Dissostichus mawsoni TaxID=36200 RepID=A0A7J5YWM8_DISMA|nr:hypothetical protein F7725_013909 [Dissostichus mawsoni]